MIRAKIVGITRARFFYCLEVGGITIKLCLVLIFQNFLREHTYDSYSASQVSFPTYSLYKISPTALQYTKFKGQRVRWRYATARDSARLRARVLRNLQRGVISSFSTKSARRNLYTAFVRDLMCSDSTSSDCGVRRNRYMVVILRSSLMSAVDLTVGLVASSSSL